MNVFIHVYWCLLEHCSGGVSEICINIRESSVLGDAYLPFYLLIPTEFLKQLYKFTLPPAIWEHLVVHILNTVIVRSLFHLFWTICSVKVVVRSGFRWHFPDHQCGWYIFVCFTASVISLLWRACSSPLTYFSTGVFPILVFGVFI